MSGDHDASDDKFFNLAGLIIPIVGAFGRIGWGLLGDKVSYKILFIVGNVVSVILQVYIQHLNFHGHILTGISKLH